MCMRTWLPLFLLLSCTGSTSNNSDPALNPEPLAAAVQAWEQDPGPTHLARVSELAEVARRQPPGDRAADVVLARAMSEVLLRPALAEVRLRPHADELRGPDAELWLTILLRAGQLDEFAREVNRRFDLTVDPALPALQAASSQAATHREMTWHRAVRAHDAAQLANQHVRLQRQLIDMPVPELPEAVRTLARLRPDSTVRVVFTRAVNQDDPDPVVSLGAIPAKAGKRRVVSYAANADELDSATATFLAAAPPRTVGLVAEIRRAGHPSEVLCGQGRLEQGQFWMVSGCSGAHETAWLQATDRYLDLRAAGRTEAEAGSEIQALYLEKVVPKGER